MSLDSWHCCQLCDGFNVVDEPPWYVIRMPGGVGGRGREAPLYPIHSIVSSSRLVSIVEGDPSGPTSA